jgi:molecular chaperone HscB
VKIDDDDFSLFGLPPRQGIDAAELDARRRSLQAATHPDRFAAEGAAAQRLAMQWAVRINEAARRLKDPLARAGYLCELRGVPVSAEVNTAMPPAFLMRQMEWREALAEAEDAEAVERLDADIAAEERALHARLRELLDEQGDTAAAAQQVRAGMFIAKLRDEVRRRLAAFDPVR